VREERPGGAAVLFFFGQVGGGRVFGKDGFVGLGVFL